MLARRAFMSRSHVAVRPPKEGSSRWLVVELDRLTLLIVRGRDGRCVMCDSHARSYPSRSKSLPNTRVFVNKSFPLSRNFY